jgi:hypothetical protein
MVRRECFGGIGMRIMIVALGLLLMPLSAQAAPSPVGSWHLDETSLEHTLDQLMATLLAQVPEDQRTDVEGLLAQQRESMRADMTKSMAATIEFQADGTVTFNEPDSTERHQGSWRLEGERLVVMDDDPRSPDLVGHLQSDRIELSFRINPDDPGHALLADLVWVLVPVR